MFGRRIKIGIGEILLAVIIILGVVGMASLFVGDDSARDTQATLIVVTSLAFIAAFVGLSVYARRTKKRFVHRVKLPQALKNWSRYLSGLHKLPPSPKLVASGTLESIAIQFYREHGYRVSDQAPPEADGLIRVESPQKELEILGFHREKQPVGLRELVAFYEVMHREKAAHGDVWSMGGFTKEASDWAKRKNLTLTSFEAINEIVLGIRAKMG
jgi:hypothetical protein